jgi:hypothetical protein
VAGLGAAACRGVPEARQMESVRRWRVINGDALVARLEVRTAARVIETTSAVPPNRAPCPGYDTVWTRVTAEFRGRNEGSWFWAVARVYP